MKPIVVKIVNQLLIIFLLSHIFTNGFAENHDNNEVVVLYSQIPLHFNPAISLDRNVISAASNIFVSLVEIDEDWQPVPYLAKKWEISADKLRYTFHLEEDTLFHDGVTLTAQDVKFSIELFKQNHPLGSTMFNSVSQINILDKDTITIQLSRPQPAFMLCLAYPLFYILPRHVYENGNILDHPANIVAVGSGPFKVVDYQYGESFVLERFENYFREGKPYIKKYVGQKYRSLKEAEIAIDNGQAHVLNFLESVPLANKLEEQSDLVVSRSGYEGFGSLNYLEFNLRKKYFSDKRVRKAIGSVIDQTFATNMIFRGGAVSNTRPIHSSSSMITDDMASPEIDFDKANQLLDEAGFERQEDGIRFKTHLTWMPENNASHNYIQLAEYIKFQLSKLDIDVQLEPPEDFLSWYISVSKWEHEMTISRVFNWGDPALGIHRLFSSKNIKHRVWSNTAGLNNKKITRLLKDAEIEIDTEKRKEIYEQFLTMFDDEQPYLFFFETPFFTFFHRNLVGFRRGVWSAVGPYDEVVWENDGQLEQSGTIIYLDN